MNLTFTHLRLLVADFPASFRFYCDGLGFEVIWGQEHDTYADLRLGSFTLALFAQGEMAAVVGRAHQPARPDGQDTAMLIFSVPSVDEAWQQLTAKGVTVAALPADRAEWGIRTAHFRDPEGNLIEINQPLPH